MLYKFEECALDDRLYELRREGELCHVEPQVFNVLLYLLRHRDRVVPKEELLEEVWGDGFVTEAALNSRIMTARKAIGDDGKEQRYIKTLRGRGFRFVGAVDEHDNEPQKSEPQILAETSRIAVMLSSEIAEPLFGRQNEMKHLRQRLEAMLTGRRQMVFVTGEAGLGKTTLVNAFLDETKSKHPYWLLHGQCLDQRGVVEAYMPFLEGLGRLCRDDNEGAVVNLLRRYAPTWLVQLPWLVSAEEWELLERRVAGATRDRMLREMLQMLDVLAMQRPLLLVLEDLHWSDHSTLDLLSALARRQGEARLLIIGTYRPADINTSGHPLRTLAQDLRIRGHCAELALSPLSESATAEYLRSRFTGWEQSQSVAALIRHRTNSNPLFMRLMVNSWLDCGWLAYRDGAWLLSVELNELAAEIPETLRFLIEQQIEQLTPECQQVLETASVAGLEFVAASLVGEEHNAETVENCCSELARHGCFLAPLGTSAWGDDALTERFGFTHHLYQEVLYERIAVSRRARLHRQIGERLEAGFSQQPAKIAGELAVHFTRGRDDARAISYLQLAAQQAMRRSACREAIAHLHQALEIVSRQPESPERIQTEIELQSALAPALIVSNGWMMPEVEASYRRARSLSEQIGAPVALASALHGLATMHEVRGEYEIAQETIEERLQILHFIGGAGSEARSNKPLLESHELLACSLFHQGQFEQAIAHADEGLKYYAPEFYDDMMATLGEDMAVSCHAWAAQAFWFSGHPHRAQQRIRLAIEQAQAPHHAYSLASAMSHAGFVALLRGEVEKVEECACASMKLAEEAGFPYRIATGGILRGWAWAARGEHEAGIQQIQKGLKVCQSAGALMDYPYYLTVLAQAYGWAKRHEEGQEALAEASSAIEKNRNFFYQAEMQRLQGNLQLQAAKLHCEEEAEASFQKALGTSRDMGAKSLELRCAISLCRLWQRQSQPSKGYELLSNIYQSFTEGFTTPDLQQAGELLKTLKENNRQKVLV